MMFFCYFQLFPTSLVKGLGKGSELSKFNKPFFVDVWLFHVLI